MVQFFNPVPVKDNKSEDLSDHTNGIYMYNIFLLQNPITACVDMLHIEQIWAIVCKDKI
jgi:hypothetical protein